jgi:hypothetical protein
LCWDCVDFDAGALHIERVQDKQTGELLESTKRTSNQRIVPMSETLRRMLAEWNQPVPRSSACSQPRTAGHCCIRTIGTAFGDPRSSEWGCHPPNVTLQYYTHSLHDGREAGNALEAVYSPI